MKAEVDLHGLGNGRSGPAGVELELLGAATRDLLGSRGHSAVVSSIVETVAAVAGTPHAYLCLPDRETGVSSVCSGSGAFASLVGYECPAGGGLSGRLGAQGHGAVITDQGTFSGQSDAVIELGVRMLVEVPLGAGGLTGVIGAGLTAVGQVFGPQQVELVSQLGRLAALKLENDQLNTFAQSELRERQRVEEELRDLIAWLQRSEDELRRSRAETIARLAHAAEFRNLETAVHVERMSRYCATVAARIGLSEERVELIRAASTLHDIGKIAIPDNVLLKPGPLSDEEQRVMMRHPEIGNELLSGSSSEVLELAALVALTHHERYDGSGYPHGLAGERIPVEGRIAAVADVFDALISDRVYRPALPLPKALVIMREGRGSHFDPEILDLFLDSIRELEAPAAEPSASPTLSAVGRPGTPESPGGASRLQAPKPERAHQPRRPLKDDRHRAPARDEVLDPERLREACTEALRILDKVGDGKEAIDLAVAQLARGWDGKLIASVYLLEHDRLWVISQRGYSDVVHDGFPLDQGVMARAVSTGQTQFIADVSSDADFVAAASGLVSEVAVPFPASAPAGVFNLETVGIGLPAEAATLFDPFVAALSVRLESMREGLGLDTASLARLCVLASSLRGTSAISEFATRTFGRLLHLESAQLALRNPDGSARISSHWRRPDSQLDPLDLAALELLDRTRDRDEAVAAFGVLAASALGRTGEADAQVPWVVWLPLRVAGREIGTLVGRAATRETDRERIEAVSLIAQHVAALIDIAQRLRREQRAATTDALTGLLNRRGFEERFAEELARAERHGEVLSLLVIDCDGLKSINDLDGHNTGDRALQQLASSARANKRVSDPAARFGGDEFAIVLTGANATEATAIAERIRNDLAAEPLGSGHLLTASIGLAVFPGDGQTTDALLQAADAALYHAKREGGNRILAAGGVHELGRMAPAVPPRG